MQVLQTRTYIHTYFFKNHTIVIHTYIQLHMCIIFMYVCMYVSKYGDFRAVRVNTICMYVCRVPASVFRFYFFELWAALYSDTSLILISDFKDVFFQADPFAFKSNHWMPDYHLAVFKVHTYIHTLTHSLISFCMYACMYVTR